MEGGVSNHYDDTDKLKMYDDATENWPVTKPGIIYNVKRLMPDVRGKTVLDLPCGIGYYTRILHDLGAAKVIASDIVPRQLEVSREKDKEHGILDGFVQYYPHDAKIPKQLCSELADVCLSIHLFCFAETIDELRRMTRTILANLKPTGCCLIIACSLGSASEDEQTFQQQLEKFEVKLVLLDPPSSERLKPRRCNTTLRGFNYDTYVWPQQVIHDVLREEGFSKVESVPCQVDPTYEGDVDIQAYIELRNLYIILASK